MKILVLGSITAFTIFSAFSYADQVIQDDLVVKGSTCTGVDCSNGESFGFDTLRLKENNLRIKFQDTSSSASFPDNDWQITINDSANGGANKFSIDDIDSGRTPFTIEAGAPSHLLYVSEKGRIGVGTSTPQSEIHILSGDTPTLRLEQDSRGGWPKQTWVISGNESNFFIRDVTGGSAFPFMIRSGAPHRSIYIGGNGNIGLKTSTPNGLLDVAHPTNANDHALLVDPSGYVGVNIDNGLLPAGIFDVQTTGGISNFTVTSSGDIGLGTTSPSAKLEVVGNAVIRGTDSKVTITDTTTGGAADVRTLLTLNSEHGSNIKFENRNIDNTEWKIGTHSSDNSFMISRADTVDINADPHDNYNLLLNDNSFIVRNIASQELMRLTDTTLTISGTFVSASSRTIKDNIESVEPREILDMVSSLPIYKWNYINDEASVKHIGPIAEEFYELFRLGSDNKHIASLDTSGIALAAIQALSSELKIKSNQIESLEKKNKQLNDRLAVIEKNIQQLLKN